ncbi:MAG TPA: ABC transporter substrate-binding protein, partial [Candidatus Baltobacteraceae bacterium]|nr:ABC transporter substrate-binding protein [Candidatus Baltobacteraceae bacterium]
KGLIVRVTEPDRFTVVFRLTRPYAGFIPTLFGSAGANPCILPKHVLAAYSTMNQAPYNALPVGIGPFRYKKWLRGDRIELEANPYYWRGRPKLARIEFLLVGEDATAITMLQTHGLDLFVGPGPASLARLSSMPDLRVLTQPSMEFAVLAFNVSHPIVADVRVRRAVEMTIDRYALLRKVRRGFGTVQESIVPPGLPITPAIPFVRYDPAGARALLDRAGWRLQSDGIRAKGGTRLSLAVSYEAQSAMQSGTVEYVRAMLHDAGIELQTKAVASARFWDTYAAGGELFAGKWDATFVTWTFPSSGDLSNLLACNQFPPTGQNIHRLCDANLDRAMAAYASSYDLARRKASMQRTAEILAQDLPMIALSIPVDGYAMTSRVEDFAPGTLTPLDVSTMMNVRVRP